MRAELCQLLKDGINLVGGCVTCGWGKNRSDKYKEIQSQYGPLGLLEVPISKIIELMEAVPCEDTKRKYYSGLDGRHGRYCHEMPTHGKTLTEKLETIKKKVCICLDCIRSSDAAMPHRFQHE